MAAFPYLPEIIVILVAAVISALIAQRLRLATLIGYLLAGSLIGPYALGFVTDVEAAQRLGGFGVVFLLFTVGLELPLDRLRVMRTGIFGLGSAQVTSTALAGAAIAILAGLSPSGAFVAGVALAMSSTAIVLQLLTERREIRSHVGRSALAVLLTQDLAVGPLLAIILAFNREPADLGAGLGLAVFEAVLALAVILVVGRWFLRPLFQPVAATRNADIFAALTILIVLITGWLTERAGLSMAFGAFLAGILLADTAYRHQVAAVVQPFRGLLLGLFFIAVGMSLDLPLLFGSIVTLSLLVPGLIGAKTVILVLLGRWLRMGWGQSLYLGLLLCQGGEFGFVLIGAGLSQGLIDGPAAQLLVAAIIVTMLIASPLASFGRFLLRQWGGKLIAAESLGHAEDLANHVIIAGFGRIGRAVAKHLLVENVPLVAIDTDPERVAKGRDAGFSVYYGDAILPDVLELLRVDRARAIVIAIDDPRATLRLVSFLRYLFPELKIFARAYDDMHEVALRHAGANGVVHEIIDAAIRLADAVVTTIKPAAEAAPTEAQTGALAGEAKPPG
jgi:CPA2 family monovalent cation:H+ antiporter-2